MNMQVFIIYPFTFSIVFKIKNNHLKKKGFFVLRNRLWEALRCVHMSYFNCLCIFFYLLNFLSMLESALCVDFRTRNSPNQKH